MFNNYAVNVSGSSHTSNTNINTVSGDPSNPYPSGEEVVGELFDVVDLDIFIGMPVDQYTKRVIEEHLNEKFNYHQIIGHDIFDIKVGSIYKFPDLKLDFVPKKRYNSIAPVDKGAEEEKEELVVVNGIEIKIDEKVLENWDEF